jgi:CRISPR-associated endonuclease Csy4
MDHYFDIRLRPDPEFGQYQLMSALFSKLHRALGERRSQDIGVSFPEVGTKRPTLGGHLRLHGPATALQQLMGMNWLVGMRDHILLGEIQAVPVKVSYRVVSRVQAKGSPERIRRRQMRRHGLSETEARERIPDTAVERLKLPFVSIRSQSTSQSFHLFIEHGVSMDVPQSGVFNSYGLSNEATVPWF